MNTNTEVDAAPASTQESDDLSDFDTVFDSLIAKGEESEDESATNQANSSGGTPGNAEQPGEPTDGVDGGDQPTEPGGDPATSNGAGPQGDQNGVPTGGSQGAQDVDWQAQFQSLQSQFEAFKAGTQQSAPAPQQSAPASQDSQVYTAEEQDELKELQQEWPDLHRLFTLMSRQVQVDTLNYAFSEFGKVIQPIQETVFTSSTNDHLAAIYEAHEDYDQVYQPVMSWIEQQPSFLKAAYQNVVKEGTADDVNLMIQRFKTETGWTAPAPSQGVGGSRPATPQAAQAPAQSQGLSDAARKAAKAMGAVTTKRGVQANAQDPNDFDGGWDEAIAMRS